MSECVVRMEMPKDNCELMVEIPTVGDWCPIAAQVCHYCETKKLPDWCPIICSLPEGHGRLIDASSKIMVPMEEDGEPHEMTIDSLLDYVTPFIESAVPAERSET